MLHHDEALGSDHAARGPATAVGPGDGTPLRAVNSSRRSGVIAAARFSSRCTETSPTSGATICEGADRLRFITNALTRLRACDADGRMLLKFKGTLAQLPAGAVPWFRAAGRRSSGARIVCGHWSALGYRDEAGVLALDTGCVWGGALTAQRLDAPSPPVRVPSTQPAAEFGDG